MRNLTQCWLVGVAMLTQTVVPVVPADAQTGGTEGTAFLVLLGVRSAATPLPSAAADRARAEKAKTAGRAPALSGGTHALERVRAINLRQFGKSVRRQPTGALLAR